jgi:hypothetical protein
MNKLICLCALLVLSYCVFAQCEDELPDSVLYKNINRSFSGLATGNGDAITLANYGSFEPANGSFKFNFFAPLGPVQKKKVTVLSFNAGGSLIGENTGVLFSNSKFSSGMNAGLKLHFPLSVSNNYSGNNEKEIAEKICIAHKKYVQDTLSAWDDFDSAYISYRYIQIQSQMDTLMKRKLNNETLRKVLTDSLNNKIARNDTTKRLLVTTELLTLFKDSKQIKLDSIELDRKLTKDARLVNSQDLRDMTGSKVTYLMTTEYEKLKDSLERTFQPKGVKALWLTATYDIERRKHYLFHSSLPFDQQVEEKKYTKHNFGIELNFAGYSEKERSVLTGPLPNFYAGNVGVTRLLTNDIDDYSTVELSDAIKYVNGDSTHNISSKYQVYVDSITTYSAWRFYGNFYRTFGKDQKYAWHLFTDVEFRSNDRNPVNAGAGVLFSIKNKKDNSVLNFEFYCKLIDIGKALPTEERFFYNRNEIGIHVGVPINIPTFK